MNNKFSGNRVRVILVVLFAYITAGLLNPSGLYNYAESLEFGPARETLLFVFAPFKYLSENTSLGTPKEVAEDYFREFAGIEKKRGFETEGLTENIIDSLNVPVDSTETAEEEKNPFEILEKIAFSKQRPLKILLLGDSMMGGSLGKMFKREAGKDSLISTRLVYEFSSGLTRVDFFDWYRETDAVFGKDTFDVMIAVLGTNDAQPAMINGKSYSFGKPEWIEAYRDKVERYFTKISDNVTLVYWLGLPAMREPGFDGRIKRLNDIYSSEAEKFLNIFYFPMAEIVGNDSTGYTDYMQIEGRFRRIRDNDGIHYTHSGGLLVVDSLLTEIYDKILYRINIDSADSTMQIINEVETEKPND